MAVNMDKELERHRDKATKKGGQKKNRVPFVLI